MGCSICSKEKHTKAKIFTVIPSRLLRDHNKSINEVYLFTSLINDGIHGKVFSCIQRISGQKRAVKIIPKRSIKGTKTRFRFMNEISVLKGLEHPNLMKLHEFFEDEKSYFLVADLVEGQDLLDFLTQQKISKENETQAVVRQVIETLGFLQEKNVSQIDLRPQKIIIEAGVAGIQVKIINYGSSVFSKSSEKIRKSKGRVEFSPPEIYLNKTKNNHDLWPAGVILFIMMTGELPFHGNNESEIIQNLIQGSYLIPESISKEISANSLDLLKKLLDPVTTSRLSATQALNHSWFSSNPSYCFSESASGKILLNLQQLQGNSQLKNSLFRFMNNELLKTCEKQELFISFKGKDLDLTGKVSLDDVRNVCKNVWGDKINFEEAEKICAELESKQSGLIDYHLFSRIVLEKEKTGNIERLENCFKRFDGTWKVFDEEVRELVEKFEVESDSWDKITEMVGMERNGMNMKEFKNLMLSLLK